MKKKLLSSLLALSFLCLGSGIALGQSAMSAKKVELLNREIATKVEVKQTKKAVSSTQRIAVSSINNATIPASVNRKAARATNFETTPYFEDFETLPEGVESPLDILPGLGWTVISGGKGKDMRVAQAGNGSTGYEDSDFFLIAPYDDDNDRNEWAITPGITLEAGTNYKFEMYGLLYGYEGVKEEFKVAVGTSNTVAAMTNVIIDITGAKAQANEDWVKYSGNFTPTVTGTYYFGINVCSPKGGDVVFFDNVLVADENYVAVPEGKIYTKGGLWPLGATDDLVILSDGQKLMHSFTGKNYSTFAWNFGSQGTPSTSTDATPSVAYAAGTQSIGLDLTGEGGTKTVTSTFEVLRPYGLSEESVGNMKPDDKIITYSIEDYGYLLGANSEHKLIAERFELPSYEEVAISGLTYYVGVAKAEAANLGISCPVYIVSENIEGVPDTVRASFDAVYSNLFGEDPVSQDAFTLSFAEPIIVKGSFYVVFDFTEFTSDANNQIGLFSTVARKYADCSSYIYYESKWSPVSKLYKNLEISACIFPTLTWTIDTNGVGDNVNDNVSVKVSTSKNLITIKDAEGLATSITTIDGRVVYNTNATTNVVDVPASSGIYIVKVGDSVAKVIVR